MIRSVQWTRAQTLQHGCLFHPPQENSTLQSHSTAYLPLLSLIQLAAKQIPPTPSPPPKTNKQNPINSLTGLPSPWPLNSHATKSARSTAEICLPMCGMYAKFYELLFFQTLMSDSCYVHIINFHHLYDFSRTAFNALSKKILLLFLYGKSE